MQDTTQFFEQPSDANNRLQQLGVTAEILLEAARRGLAAFAACTPNHPRNFPPMASWAATIAALGELFASRPFGWRRIDDSGQPLILNPQESIALTVAGADANTGRLGGPAPRTTSSKGRTTVRAIARNAFLFPEMEEDAQKEITKEQKRNTWFLLIHRDMVSGEMRCELSKPSAMGEDRHIDSWSERILLPSTSFDAAVLALIPNDDNEMTGEISVEIKRRA